jgi:LytS/YehU family sensor histidine kinase
LRYRWKLSEIDPDWTPATTVNIATYPNLLPGKYTFQVQASVDGNWNNQSIQLEFTIDQPFWQKFWFIFFEIVILVFILFLIIFFIIKRQKRRAKIQNEKLRLEKNLLELEQKALRLQMNPHFIFNVLNSIHNLIILNDSDKARYALSKFSKLMRQVLENSREKFISITTEVETLQNYIQLEKLTSNSNIDLLFDFDEDIDTEEEILPPLMIQPFVENALIHGFKGMDKKGEIKVSFKWFHQDILECTISDNGIGRKKASETNAQKTDYHKSTALNVAQERLANLNQNKTFVPFEIIDLVDEFNQPSGTKVVIRIQVV